MSLLLCHLALGVSGVSSRLYSPLKQNFFLAASRIHRVPSGQICFAAVDECTFKKKKWKKIYKKPNGSTWSSSLELFIEGHPLLAAKPAGQRFDKPTHSKHIPPLTSELIACSCESLAWRKWGFCQLVTNLREVTTPFWERDGTVLFPQADFLLRTRQRPQRAQTARSGLESSSYIPFDFLSEEPIAWISPLWWRERRSSPWGVGLKHWLNCQDF